MNRAQYRNATTCLDYDCPVETFDGHSCPCCGAEGMSSEEWNDAVVESLAADDEELRRYGPPDDPFDRAPIGGDYWRDPESGEYRFG